MIPWLLSFIVRTVADFYMLLIFAYVIMSWFPTMSGWVATLYEALSRICEPYLRLFRKIIPPVGGLDFSPIVAVVVLQLIVRLLF